MASALTAEFALNSSLAVASFAAQYAQQGRLHIPQFLETETANALHAHLVARQDWQLLFNHGEQIYELNSTQQAELGTSRLAELTRAAQNSARDRFQYLFENIRISDLASERAQRATMLDRCVDWLNTPVVLNLLRRITGRNDIAFADGQATCYRAGHFLGTHNDNVDGKNRIAAYVLSLTPQWREDWGGQLQFVTPAGHIAEAFVPRFNALNLLRVPQAHLVSCVSPWANLPRYSITGWLRHGEPPR